MSERPCTSRVSRWVTGATVLAVMVGGVGCGSRRDSQEIAAANPPAGGVTTPAVPATGAEAGAPQAGVAPGAVLPNSPTAATAPGAAAAPGAGQAQGRAPSGTTSKVAPVGAPAPGAAAGANRCATSGSVITLGNISTQSGLLGELFKGIAESVQVWAKSANACGGFGGHPVRVISGDDGGDPATALTVAQRMVENDKALAFVGLTVPLSVAGIENYLKDKGVPVIGGDSSETPFFTNPVFFPIGPFVSVIGAADAAIAIQKGAKKLAVLYCVELPASCGPEAASKELQVGSPVVKAMGGEVLLSQKASLVAPSFTSQCIAAKRAGAEAIIAILDGPSVGRLASNCQAQDYSPLYLGISTGIGSNLLNYPAVNNNFFAPLNTFPWVDTSLPATKAYADNMQKYFGRLLPGPSPAMAYASGVMGAEAVKGGLPADPTSADILKAMYTIKNNTLGGLTAPLTFTEKVPRTGITSCYFMIAIANGTFVAPKGSSCLPVNARGPA